MSRRLTPRPTSRTMPVYSWPMHQRRRPREQPLGGVDVGAADAGGVHGHQRLARARRRVGRVVDGEAVAAAPGGRLHGLRMTRVAAVPVFLPCHSAKVKALLTSSSGKLWETTFDSGYLSFVRTRKSSAAGMIHGL